MKFEKANFQEQDILKILQLYPVDLDKVKVSNLNGIANNNYRVTGNNFDIVLKVYSHGQSDKNKIEKELEVLRLFKRKGIRVPKIIVGRNLKILQEFKGFNIVATKFIPGDVFDTLDFTPNRMNEIGRIVAQVETEAKQIDISSFTCMNLKEEFDYVSKNLNSEMTKKHYDFDLSLYSDNLSFIKEVIQKLDNSKNKQFLHKDIWPWNLIKAKDGIYLLDFNDWSIGDPIIELSVALLEFSMFKSDQFNTKVALNIFRGYKSLKELRYKPKDLWETMLFICYLYFPYNVIQAEDRFEAEIYLKRIDTLFKNPNLLDLLL